MRATSRLLLLALLLAAGCSRDLVVLKPGDTAPAFALKTPDGETISLEELRGRYVFVRFWADWCKSCRTEMPMIEGQYRLHREDGLRVLAVNVRQDAATASRFAGEVGISYPVLLDTDGGVAKAYGVVGLPTTFLVDRDGKIVEEVLGDMNRKSLADLVDPLFAQPGGAASQTQQQAQPQQAPPPPPAPPPPSGQGEIFNPIGRARDAAGAAQGAGAGEGGP